MVKTLEDMQRQWREMKIVAIRAGLAALLTGLVLAAPGCASQEVPHGIKGSQMESSETTFLTDIKALPANQRSDYIHSHMEIFEMLKNDPDKSKLAELQSLLPPKGS